MKVILFRSRLRDTVDVAAYREHAAAVLALAKTMPGFVSSQDFLAEDGERLAVIRFEDTASLSGWRTHPEHRKAQARGRAEYYASFRVEVCELERQTAFPPALRKPNLLLKTKWSSRA